MRASTIRAAIVLLLLEAVRAVPALAHHSTALFDLSKTVTLKGTVERFNWVNPHVILYVGVDGDKGEKQVWAVELASPGVLTRNGWSKRSFNPGDAVTVDVGPMRDGQHGGFFKKAVLADGQTLTFTLQP